MTWDGQSSLCELALVWELGDCNILLWWRKLDFCSPNLGLILVYRFSNTSIGCTSILFFGSSSSVNYHHKIMCQLKPFDHHCGPAACYGHWTYVSPALKPQCSTLQDPIMTTEIKDLNSTTHIHFDPSCRDDGHHRAFQKYWYSPHKCIYQFLCKRTSSKHTQDALLRESKGTALLKAMSALLSP